MVVLFFKNIIPGIPGFCFWWLMRKENEMIDIDEILETKEISIEAKEINEYDEFFSYKEREYYPSNLGNEDIAYRKKNNKVAKVSSIALSTIGISAIASAIILAISRRIEAKPKITNLVLEYNEVDHTINYSFDLENKNDIVLYFDIEVEGSKINPISIKETDSYSGIFDNIDNNTEYTFVVYENFMNVKKIYYEKKKVMGE